ncbi:MAG: histidine kinase dimerization/phospho-acceptor domain-containing protein [Bacteroidota bacterium]|nr:histidine kinase dimerization/phospho-acceptor domain-containing protein [Bacteroidota bacterium]MDP4217718.1 histidine kinase dimerization/phospho-acceptor domain-containing protein [Bacteroidota bacterium]MDP4247544.1 histidine kinase dimerization/phospho-acceptor domain-containing protein [Bacteroidota bacterium]MDP4254152.1 histidine kinase dimerization/phospho-acceptor domain-containing protein [Bacteroidota bacterium]MDP4259636.1 histidine kinase dimerization/phospho-acceptor domain-co
MTTNILVVHSCCDESRVADHPWPSGAIYILTHEMRDPLGNVNLACDMLGRTDLTADQKHFVEIILRSSARINTLCDGVLQCCEVPETNQEPYAIRQILDDVLLLLENRIAHIIGRVIDGMPQRGGKLRLVTRPLGETQVIEIHQ